MKIDNDKISKMVKAGIENFYSNSDIRYQTAKKLLNIRFLDNDQWIYFDKKSNQILNQKYDEAIGQVTANYMLSFIESIKARILSLNPRARVVPMTRDWADFTMALSYTKFFRGIINNIDFDDLLQDIADIMIVCSGVFIRPFWNSGIDNVDLDIRDDITAYVDPMAKRSSDIRYIMFFDIKSIDYIKEEYKSIDAVKTMKPDDLSTIMSGWYLTVFSELNESKENNSMGGRNKIEINDAVLCTYLYYKDGKKNMCSIVAKDVVLDTYEVPSFPIYIPYYKNAFSKRGRTPLDSLRAIQREINYFLTTVKADGRKVPKMLKEESITLSDDSTTFDFDSSEIVSYKTTRPGQRVEVLNPPAARTTDLNVFISQWAEVGGQFESSRGRVPTSQASGRLVESLIDQDETKLGNVKTNLKSGLRRVFKEIKKIVDKNYDSKRVVTILGRDRGWEAYNYSSFKERTNYFDVDIEIGSSLPTSSGSKINTVMSLAGQGIFNDLKNPSKFARELMDLSVFELDVVDQDVDKQNVEIERVIKGEAPAVQTFDDHLIHLEVLLQFFKTLDFEQLDAKKKKILFAHKAQHEQYIMAMMANQSVTGNIPNNAVNNPQQSTATANKNLMTGGAV